MATTTSSRGSKSGKPARKAAKAGAAAQGHRVPRKTARTQVREDRVDYQPGRRAARVQVTIFRELENLVEKRAGKFHYATFNLFSPLERIEAVRHGLPAGVLASVAEDLKVEQGFLIDHLGLARSTIARKVKDKLPLSLRESESVLGIAQLVGLVETMVLESGAPEGFDAAEWVGKWISKPHPAIANRTPVELLDTAEGQGLVASILERSQSGAYA